MNPQAEKIKLALENFQDDPTVIIILTKTLSNDEFISVPLVGMNFTNKKQLLLFGRYLISLAENENE